MNLHEMFRHLSLTLVANLKQEQIQKVPQWQHMIGVRPTWEFQTGLQNFTGWQGGGHTA